MGLLRDSSPEVLVCFLPVWFNSSCGTEVHSDTRERMNICVLPAVIQEEIKLQLRVGGYVTPPTKKKKLPREKGVEMQ